VRSPQDRVVKRHVVGGVRLRVASGLAQRIELLAHRGEVTRCGTISGQRGRLRLDDTPQFETVGHDVVDGADFEAGSQEFGGKVVPGGSLGHAAVATLSTRHHAERGDDLDRFSHNRHAYLELVGDVARRRQRLARLKQCVTDVLDDYKTLT
jgi:hypothetical protein